MNTVYIYFTLVKTVCFMITVISKLLLQVFTRNWFNLWKFNEKSKNL